MPPEAGPALQPPAVSDGEQQRQQQGQQQQRQEWEHLIIVARADPIVCGHATEARHLAEAAIAHGGFRSVHIVTYPLEAIARSGLPVQQQPPAEGKPYSPGIYVHRPAPVGDEKILDGRLLHGLSGCLLALLLRLRPRPTLVLQLYLVPHGRVVMDAVQAARAMPFEAGNGAGQRPFRVATVAKACGSEVTGLLASAAGDAADAASLDEPTGAALLTLANYLAHDVLLAVSRFARAALLEAASRLDDAAGTAHFAKELAARVRVSYPPVAAGNDDEEEEEESREWLERRFGVASGRFALFLSRHEPCKGLPDLLDGYARSEMCRSRGLPLLLCTTGPDLPGVHALVRSRIPPPYQPQVRVISSFTPAERRRLYGHCAAFILPSKRLPAGSAGGGACETFGIVLVEKALAGGLGPTLATRTGGMPEATGGHCLDIEAGEPASIATQLDRALRMPEAERAELRDRARAHALRFERGKVFRELLGLVDEATVGMR